MTPEALERWRLEDRLLQDELARLEAAMRAVLRKLRCPLTPVAIHDLLNGDRAWLHRLASRDKPRARDAMFALQLLGDVRSHIGLRDGDPLRAATTALRAALAAAAAMPRRDSTRPPGSEHDRRIVKCSRLYDRDEDLREEYRRRGGKAAFIKARLDPLEPPPTPPTLRTIQRRLKALKLS